MVWRGLGGVSIMVVLVYGAGFITFSRAVETKPLMPEVATEAIVVLTGASDRLDVAIDLLISNRGERLLISGVDPSVRRDTIIKLTGSNSALFECCVDMDRYSTNTAGNAVETAQWVKEHKYTSLMIVTSADHMPRVLVEMERRMPGVSLVPYPVSGASIFRPYWWLDPPIVWRLATEYTKYLLALGVGFRASL